MRLHYHPMSRCSLRVLLVARHLGLPLELVPVDLFHGEQRAAAFLALNPNHRVPVLQDGDFVLWESFAIVQYLAEGAPGQTLYPAARQARADVDRWMFWCAQHLAPALAVLNRENVIKGLLGQGGPDAAEVQRAEAQVKELGEVLDRHLEGRAWICGDSTTLADFAIAAPLADAAPARFPIGGFAHLQRWRARVQSLDAWAAATGS